jgi:ABC-type transport system substrate-binding protein
MKSSGKETRHEVNRSQANATYEVNATQFTRRDWLSATGSAMLAGIAGAVGMTGPAAAQTAPKRGGVLRVSGAANPSSLDPQTGGAGSDHTYLWVLYDTLVEWDYGTLNPKPGMASWAFTDPKTMVLTIKPGITFHDGNAMDAAAVKFNLDRGREHPRSNIKADLSSIEATEIIGPLQLTVKLKRADSALPAILSDRAGMMISPKASEQFGNDFDRNPVGAGPWKFVSWADNQKIVTARYDKYWRSDRGFLDGIEFAIIPELATGLRSVVAGQNDLVYSLPPRLKPIAEKAKGVVFAQGPTLYIHQLWLNVAKKSLENLKVRQALNYAIDREAFLKAALNGIGEIATMQLPSGHWAYDKSVSTLYPYDPDKARKLLEEAGYKNNLEITCGSYTDQDSVRRAEIMIEQLSKVGVKLTFTRGTVAEISAQFFSPEKKFDTLLSAWTGRPDPSMTYGLMYEKSAYFNSAKHEVSPEFQALLAESRASDNLEIRKQVFAKIQRTVMEQALVVPLAVSYEITAMSDRVKGYQTNLLGKAKYEFLSMG